MYQCWYCDLMFNDVDERDRHMNNDHADGKADTVRITE